MDVVLPPLVKPGKEGWETLLLCGHGCGSLLATVCESPSPGPLGGPWYVDANPKKGRFITLDKGGAYRWKDRGTDKYQGHRRRYRALAALVKQHNAQVQRAKEHGLKATLPKEHDLNEYSFEELWKASRDPDVPSFRYEAGMNPSACPVWRVECWRCGELTAIDTGAHLIAKYRSSPDKGQATV